MYIHSQKGRATYLTLKEGNYAQKFTSKNFMSFCCC